MPMLPAAAFNDISKRPSSLLTYVDNKPYEPCASTQKHHLIPHELWERMEFLNDPHVLQVLTSAELDEEGRHNIIELPSTRSGAMSSNMALHNGSHPIYTKFVENKIIDIEMSYRTMQMSDPAQADIYLKTAVFDLDLELTHRLDRSFSGSFKQIALNSSDPHMALVDPAYRSEMFTLATLAEEIRENPRLAFPTKAMAESACKLVEELTPEAVRKTAIELRKSGWAHIPEKDRPKDIEAGALSIEQIEQGLNKIKQHEIDNIRQQSALGQSDIHSQAHAQAHTAQSVQAKPTFAEIVEKTAQEHPFDAAMAKVGVAMMAGAGAYALGAGGAVGAAVNGAAELTSGALAGAARLAAPTAVGAATSVMISDPAQALPAYNSMNAGRDDMGERGNVDHISWRFTGLPAGDAGNTLAALAARDTAPDRAGGALTHCGAHLLVKADGTIEQDSAHARPLSLNPQIDAGKNSNAIGVYVEGDGQLTAAQRATLTALNTNFSQQRLQAGELTQSVLTPATIVEDMAWDTSGPGPSIPAPNNPALGLSLSQSGGHSIRRPALAAPGGM